MEEEEGIEIDEEEEYGSSTGSCDSSTSGQFEDEAMDLLESPDPGEEDESSEMDEDEDEEDVEDEEEEDDDDDDDDDEEDSDIDKTEENSSPPDLMPVLTMEQPTRSEFLIELEVKLT